MDNKDKMIIVKNIRILKNIPCGERIRFSQIDEFRKTINNIYNPDNDENIKINLTIQHVDKL